jgi:hypothetical protein
MMSPGWNALVSSNTSERSELVSWYEISDSKTGIVEISSQQSRYFGFVWYVDAYFSVHDSFGNFVGI